MSLKLNFKDKSGKQGPVASMINERTVLPLLLNSSLETDAGTATPERKRLSVSSSSLAAPLPSQAFQS